MPISKQLKRNLVALVLHGRSLFLKPKPFDFDCKEKRAVIVVCHPDDETFCSGLICSLAVEQWTVFLVCATRGEGAKLKMPPQEIAELRTKEMLNAANILGVNQVEFLDMPDTGRLGSVELSIRCVTQVRLNKVLQAIQPSIVVTHGRDGEYGHPGHLLTRNICLEAVQAVVPGTRVFGMNAAWLNGPMRHLKNNTAPASCFIDGCDHSEIRLAALRQHRSQSFVFRDWAGSLEAFIRDTQIERYSIDTPAKSGCAS